MKRTHGQSGGLKRPDASRVHGSAQAKAGIEIATPPTTPVKASESAMSRLTALLVSILALAPATGCYDPEMPAGQVPAPSTSSSEPADECTGDCQICADYCTTMIVCSSDPPSVQDCAFDCINALDSSTPECSDARKDAMSCVGTLTCEEFASEGPCAAELEDFTVQCEGEYDEEPMDAPTMIAS